MKKFPLALVFLALFSGSSVNLLAQKPVDAQVTKACTAIQPIDGISIKVPIDPKSQKPVGEELFVAFAYKVLNGYSYHVFVDKGRTVSQVDLTYFKDKKGVQKVRIKVCGLAQYNPNIPYLNLNFGSGKIVNIKALGTQNLVFTVPKNSHTSKILTSIEV